MPPVAAIDCGTNSTRLLVADEDGRSLTRRMTITRLGAGVDRTRRLAGDAVGRTLAVLREYRGIMDDLEVDAVRMTATSAARDAANRSDFLTAAAEVVGVAPELLDGEEEARLSFAGATADLDPATGPWLVADVGGGSTELAAGPAAGRRLEPRAVRSVDMGCVRVTERFLAHDPPRPAELEAGRRFVAAELESASSAAPGLRGAARLIGLAGTVAAAAMLDLRLDHYDRAAVHHRVVTAATVASLLDELATLDVGARRARPGMEPERAPVIVGGLLVLDGILGHFGFPACLASEADILDGLAMSLLPDLRRASRAE